MIPPNCRYKFVVKDKDNNVLIDETVAVAGASTANLLDLIN
jgi:hypothetical protein